MKNLAAAIIASCLVGDSFATFFDWREAPNFDSPSLVNNKCVDQQKSGWTFESIPEGPVKSFSSFSFDGFSCSGIKSKRDLSFERGGQFSQKPIKGVVSRTSGPSFACGSSDSFSINQYEVTADRDVDIEFHYTMGDGSSCSHVSRCSGSGTTIKNLQCGGAKTVSFKLPEQEKGDCGINIHGIDFDCGPSEKPPTSSLSSKLPLPASTSHTAYPVASSLVLPEASSSLKNTEASAPVPSATASPASSQAMVSDVPGSSIRASSVPSSSAAKAQTASPASTLANSASAYAPSSASPIIVSSHEATSKSSASSSTSSDHPSKSGETVSPLPTSDCPDLLPQCLNTWIFKTSCKDNTDTDCFCKDDNFIGEAYGCLSAWGKADDEIQAAVAYLVGLCAKFIPTNPGIITNCPTSISIVAPTPIVTPAPAVSRPPIGEIVTTHVIVTKTTTCSAGETVTRGTITEVLATPSVSTVTITSTTTTTVCNEACSKQATASTTLITPPPAVGITTISIDKTVTMPLTHSTGSEAGQTLVSSFTTQVIATTVVVPQVAFSSATASGTSGIVLVPGPSLSAAGVASSIASTTLLSSAISRSSATASPVPEQFLGAADSLQGPRSLQLTILSVIVAALFM